MENFKMVKSCGKLKKKLKINDLASNNCIGRKKYKKL